MTETAPLPVFRTFAQITRHWVAVDVAKFLHKLLDIAHVEIVVTLLPEVRGLADQSARNTLFQRLDCIRKQCVLGFTDKKMHVFRHYNIGVDAEFERSAHAL